MNLGANLEPIALPWASKKPPGVKIAPAAMRTPVTFFTFGSRAAPTVGVSPLSCSTTSFALTTTLVPFSESLKISSKAAKVVSVRMYVPATKATPITTARVVAIARALRAQRLLRARLVNLLHQLDYLVRRAGGGVVDETTVAKSDQAVRVCRCGWVVGDHDHRLA